MSIIKLLDGSYLKPSQTAQTCCVSQRPVRVLCLIYLVVVALLKEENFSFHAL